MINSRYYIVVAVVFLVSFFTFFFKIKYDQNFSNPKKSSAESESSTITSQANWDSGSKTNIDSATSAGSIKISDKSLTQTKISFASAVTSANADEGDAGKAIDGDTALASNWAVTMPEGCFAADPPDPCPYWKLDMGEVKDNIKRIKFMRHDLDLSSKIFYSTDDSSYTLLTTTFGGTWPDWYDSTLGSSFSARYIKIKPKTNSDFYAGYSYGIYELELYQVTGGATHIASVDGGENFWKWDANTISESVPANTSTSYQYRTSANGTDWTAWVGAIGSVTNRTGDDDNNPTRYRYLQIKATLTNTDGVSTPTIDSYDIDYHTEVKPTAPSAETATTQ